MISSDTKSILIATHFFPPGHLGGTEILSLGLAKSLQELGHDVHVICAEGWNKTSDNTIQTSDDYYQDIPVRRLHFNWKQADSVFRNLFNNPRTAEHVRVYMESVGADVLHVTSCYTLSASIFEAAHLLGKPSVLTATDFWFICARNTLLKSDGTLCEGPTGEWKCAQCMLSESKIYRWPDKFIPEKLLSAGLIWLGRYRWFTRMRGVRGLHGAWNERFQYLSSALKSIDKIVTASMFVQQKLVEFGAPANKVDLSPYGLDTSWVVQRETELPSQALRIGFIGQIVPMKGLQILLYAFRNLVQNIAVELRVYGDLRKDPNFGEYLKEIASDDPRIHFLGVFDNSNMGEVLNQIDILVIPSIWYDFPLVIPSAFATKTPVIATDLPGMNEMITHDVDGLLFPRGDWNALAKFLNQIASDKTILDRLQRGIKPVKTLSQMADEYSKLYDKLLE